MGYLDDSDDVQFREPIKVQKGVKLKLNFAEKCVWNNKHDGLPYDACKLTLDIDDASVSCEHEDARPKTTIQDQFNIVSYPIKDKNTGEMKKMGRTKLMQLEDAFGFDPVFQVNGVAVEPRITHMGNKVAPKVEGVKRVINPEFFKAYFTEDGTPRMENWSGKTIYADIGVEKSEQYGDKNVIQKYVPAPKV